MREILIAFGILLLVDRALGKRFTSQLEDQNKAARDVYHRMRLALGEPRLVRLTLISIDSKEPSIEIAAKKGSGPYQTIGEVWFTHLRGNLQIGLNTYDTLYTALSRKSIIVPDHVFITPEEFAIRATRFVNDLEDALEK